MLTAVATETQRSHMVPGRWRQNAQAFSQQDTPIPATHTVSTYSCLGPLLDTTPPPTHTSKSPNPTSSPSKHPPPHTPAGGILRGLSAPAATRSRRSLSAMAVAAPVSAAAKQAEFVKQAHGFSLVQQQFVREYDSHVLMYKHDKTGGWVGG